MIVIGKLQTLGWGSLEKLTWQPRTGPWSASRPFCPHSEISHSLPDKSGQGQPFGPFEGVLEYCNDRIFPSGYRSG